MFIHKFERSFIRGITESGRTMLEVLAILAIMGILSVGGFWMFSASDQERQINDIIYHMNLQVTQIYPAMQKEGEFISKDQLNKFLASYKKNVGNYILNFRADPNANGNDLLVEVTRADGKQIKGKMCRALISKSAKLKMAQDVSFSLKDEEMDDGSVQDVLIPLNGQIIDYKAVCGG